MQKDFNVLQENFSTKYVTNLDISLQSGYQKSQQTSSSFKNRKPRAHQLQAGALHTHQDDGSNVSDLSDTDESFCLQMKIQKTQFSHPQVPKPVCLMANLDYHLQMHHRKNQYLCASLDTCTDVNLMLVVVYQLMFKDRSLKKLTPSTMEIETYTSDAVKIIGTCQFYLLHPENKELIKVIFFVAKEKWESFSVMQDNYGTWTDQVTSLTRVFTTKS